MKYFLSLCLMSLSLPLLAQTTVNQGAAPDPLAPGTFPMEVNLKAEGLNIEATTTSLGKVASVSLTNQGDAAVQCNVTFNNGPEIAGPVMVELAPGAQVEATETLDRDAIIVRADVECERA